jgi:hypothetical protein
MLQLVSASQRKGAKNFRGSEWFGMVRDRSDWFEGEREAQSGKRKAGRAQSARVFVRT